MLHADADPEPSSPILREDSWGDPAASRSSATIPTTSRRQSSFGRLGCGRFGFGFICGAVSVMTFNSLSSQFGMSGPEWRSVGLTAGRGSGGAVYDTAASKVAVGGDRKSDSVRGRQQSATTNQRMTVDQIVANSKQFFKGFIVMSRSAWIMGKWGRGGNKFCPDSDVALANATHQPLPSGKRRPILMNVTFESESLFRNANTGQGNWIEAMYGMRLQSFQRHVDMMLYCEDADASKALHILPWLAGYFPTRDEDQTPFPFPHPPPPKRSSKLLDSCEEYELSEMAPFVRHDLRRMAIALIGIPYKGHPSEAWAEEWLWSGKHPNPDIMQLTDPKRDDPPIVPDIDVDATAIHFRCEDLMATNHPSFGFMKFTAYSRRIYPSTRSIGIVTNPFDEEAQNRGGAGRRGAAIEACKTVTLALRDFLSEQFPAATVSIRNGRDETVATAFARLVMANQTIAGISSFGIWTAVANFGHGFIRKPDYPKAPNGWAPPLPDMYDDITLFSEPKRLPAYVASRMKGDMDSMLKWFKNDNVDAPK